MNPDRLCLFVFCLSLVVSGSYARSYRTPGLSKGEETSDHKRNVPDNDYDVINIDDDDFSGLNPDDENGKTIDEIIVDATNKAHGIDSNATVNSSDPNRLVTIEYDMVFTAKELEEEDNDATSKDKRTAAIRSGVEGSHRWGTYIPYQFAPNTFTDSDKREIIAGMDDWAKYTCLKFGPATSGTRLYFKDGEGCDSYVGMRGGPQNIRLGKGCRGKGTVIHEVGHAIGLLHEQTRPDRDSFVTIMEDNIIPKWKGAFKKRTWDTVMNLGIRYDYISIMHYGQRAFTKNKEITIKTKHSAFQDIIGNRRRLSFRDIKTVNLMQKCAKVNKCKLTDADCPGEAFVGKDCKCWCPGDPYTLCWMKGGEESNCEDENTNCPGWAKAQHCTSDKYKKFMTSSCKKSCGLCKSNCKEENTNCPAWAKAQHCTSDKYKKFMTSSCKISCGLCNTVTSCKDEHESCAAWAKRGECVESSKYMSSKCKWSCNINNCRSNNKLLEDNFF